MPTPAVRATASRLASGPPALNTVLAASSSRSRFRCASARGFREAVLSNVLWSNGFLSGDGGLKFFQYKRLEKRRDPPYLTAAILTHNIFVPSGATDQAKPDG